jgi:hypothetical protein
MAKRTQLNQLVADKGIMSNLLIIPTDYKDHPDKHTQLIRLRRMYADYLYADFSIYTVSNQLAIYLDINVIQEDDKKHRDALRAEYIAALCTPTPNIPNTLTLKSNDNEKK